MSINKKLLRRRKEHREVFEMIKKSDITIQVLDARFPQKCRSKTLEDFARNKEKQILFCINKADLVPQEINNKWKKILSRELPTVFISTSERQGTSKLRQQIQRFSNSENIMVCVIGYPNVGKSSLINVLKGRKSAPISPKAGFTRHLRSVRISPKLMLIDTPGVAPRDGRTVEEEVFIGTISPEDITNPDICVSYIFDRIKMQNLTEELGIYLKISINDILEQPLNIILERYARRRGLIKKGGMPLVDEAARILIRDFIMGKILYYEDPDIVVE